MTEDEIFFGVLERNEVMYDKQRLSKSAVASDRQIGRFELNWKVNENSSPGLIFFKFRSNIFKVI